MKTASAEDTNELDGSELGTKAYWDQHYSREVANFQSHKDPGEVWFGEDSADRIIRYIEDSDEITHTSSIIDLGCGNGMLLLELACAGFRDLAGVDYSANAIQLASMVALDKNVHITFEAGNFLDIAPSTEGGVSEDEASAALPACLRRQYDVCHDKGTYDAVSLHPESPRDHRNRYVRAVVRLLRPGGLLVITSCNWTRSELEAHLCPTLQLVRAIPTPSFCYGGHSGSLVTSLVLRKPS